VKQGSVNILFLFYSATAIQISREPPNLLSGPKYRYYSLVRIYGPLASILYFVYYTLVGLQRLQYYLCP